MKRAVTAAAAAAITAMLILTGCTLGHTADTSQNESAAETPTPAPAESTAETPTPTPIPATDETPTPTPTEAPQEPVPSGMVKSYLTGEYVTPEIGRTRPVSFMIDNSSDAIPQSGISAADIIYEATVEADYTRLCAVFEDFSDQSRIGPLRSCRDYFISFVSGLDAIYEHYGRAAYALPYLESDDVDNISGLLPSTYDCFYRDYTFHSGFHTAYIGYDGIQKAIGIRGYSTQYKDGFTPMYQFAWVGKTVTNDGGRDAEYVAPGYSYNHPNFVYNADDGQYYRSQFGSSHVDAENGNQLYVKNIILEYENWDYYMDTAEFIATQNRVRSHYLHFDTTSGGKGKYITNGKAIDITWERKSFYEPAKYYDTNGNEITLNTGKTWVCIIQNDKLADCKIGTSADTATCVESDADVAEAKSYYDEWVAAYENGEPQYLATMSAELQQELAEHGGQTKVGEGDG
ncbi:MAG: DUF3048 domain-containing protein [Lachnospiraceae bacterium]|jgi:hypothetical protein|nr:DUF3048 domain-containing protein [Lachnospiraceae bacterium]